MKPLRNAIWGMMILAGCLSFASRVDAQEVNVSRDSNTREGFEEALSHSIERLELVLRKNPPRLRKVSESLTETIEAAKLLAQDRERKRALNLARSAAKKYSDNVLAYLVASELYDAAGDSQKANRARLEFLKKSARAPWIARETMSWEDRTNFFDYVTEKLKRDGIKPPASAHAKQISLMEKIAWEEGNKLRDLISVGLPLIVCLGLGYHIFLLVSGAEIWLARRRRIVLEFYLLCLGLYILWILHLFTNLPAFIDPVEMEITLIFFAGSAAILGTHLIQAILERRKELLDPEAMPCPHCQRVIVKIVTECPYCRRKIEAKD